MSGPYREPSNPGAGRIARPDWVAAVLFLTLAGSALLAAFALLIAADTWGDSVRIEEMETCARVCGGKGVASAGGYTCECHPGCAR